jgi:hypothetical protein
MFGLNIDPNNIKGNPDPAELGQLGVEIVRYTYADSSGRDQLDSSKARFYQQKIQGYQQVGISSLVILDYQTYPNKPAHNARDGEWDAYIDRLARRCGQIAQLLAPWRPAFQIWNEPDHPPKPDYEPTLREAVFGRMMRRAYEAIKAVEANLFVVGGGLSAGNPSWLEQVIQSVGGDLSADAIAFHPYGQRPHREWPKSNWGFGYVGDLLNNYYRAGGNRPLWITEMGVKEEDLNQDRGQVAEFLRRYYRLITNYYSNKVQQVIWFCYSDGMVPTFGLLDGAGRRKPAYNAYREVAAARPRLQPQPVAPSPLPTTPSVATVAVGATQPSVAPPSVAVAPPPPPSIFGGTPPTPSIPINVPASPATSINEPLEQLRNQVTAWQAQAQQLQSQIAQFQSQLRQLLDQQAQLQSQTQGLSPQPLVGPQPAVVPTSPPASSVGRPAPPIQNITHQLKRHPSLQFPTRPLSQIQRIIIHHTAISPTIGAERVAEYRVDTQGWPGIGYHYFITHAGLIQQTNELTTQSTHAGQYDPVAIGICFAGNFMNEVPTSAQIEAGAQLIAWLLPQFGLTPAAVSGYKELVNTQSPGLQWDSGARWGDQLKRSIRA